MASACTHIAEWLRRHLSSVVTFQKQFVDDVSEKVKERKAQLDRHARDVRDRAVRRHLDELEEKYLCSVCGKAGEVREDDGAVYDTYSMIELPPRTVLEAAVREELADAELSDERMRQHKHMLVTSKHARQPPSNNPTATHESDSDSCFSSSSLPNASVALAREGSERVIRERQRNGKDASSQERRQKAGNRHHRHNNREARTANDAFERNVTQSPPADTSTTRSVARRGQQMQVHKTDLAVMDPDMVGPLEIRNTLYKIQHAVLHKEARVRRKSSAIHRDKGLMMIEESEIEIFSHFFQRPLHGYLCMDCYVSAGRRLDALTKQIRTILFKAEHPVLRRLPAKELESLMVSNQYPATLAHSIAAVQQRWAKLTEEQRIRLSGAEAGVAPVQDPSLALDTEGHKSGASEQTDPAVPMATLSEKSILILRGEVRCGACQRRRGCYFEPKSVVFLCQFCTARDRFYRENAVCVNDEPMPVTLVRLLRDLSDYYEGIHQQKELYQAPVSVIAKAQTDLFPLTEVMSEKGGLFACQAPALAKGNHHDNREESQEESTLSAHVATAKPCTSAVAIRQIGETGAPLHDQRDRAGKTMISLFDGVKVERHGLDLFNNATLASSAVSAPDLFQVASVPPHPSPPSNGRSAQNADESTVANSLGYSTTDALLQPPISTSSNAAHLQSTVPANSVTVSSAQPLGGLPEDQNSEIDNWF